MRANDMASIKSKILLLFVILTGIQSAAYADDPYQLPPQVRMTFLPGTAFISYSCNYNPFMGNVCSGPYYVGNTYYLMNTAGSKFCLEVNRFAGWSWGHYYFKVEKDYTGEPIEVWGASTNPKFSLPKGITLYKTDVSSDFTLCNPPWSNE